jgi:hypothetical protein
MTTYIPPFLDQSTNHCVEEVNAFEGDMVGLADVGCNEKHFSGWAKRLKRVLG